MKKIITTTLIMLMVILAMAQGPIRVEQLNSADEDSAKVIMSNGHGVAFWANVSSMVYPGAGIPVSTGSAWGTSITNTTVGTNFLTATNPSAVTFPRVNADNSVDFLSDADFRTAIGAESTYYWILKANGSTVDNINNFETVNFTGSNGITISGSTATINIDGSAITGGATNLSYTSSSTTGTVNSDTGTDATIPAATTSIAGLLTASDKTKLDGIVDATNLSYTSSSTTGTVNSDTGTDATIPAATTSIAGLLTASDKTKLDGIATSSDNYGYWGITADVGTLSLITSHSSIDFAGTGGIQTTYSSGTLTIDGSGISGTGQWSTDTNGITYSSGNVGINHASASTTSLYVDGGSNYGIYGTSSGTSGIGLYGVATASSGTVYGGYFSAQNSSSAIGLKALGSSVGVYASSSNTGLYAVSSASSGHAIDAVATGTGSVGCRAAGLAYDFYANGAGVDYGSGSSIRWKKHIKPIDNALAKIDSLRGVTFDWDKQHGSKHDVGFIAEEVGKVLPEIVVFEPDSVYAKGMDYSKMTPLLLQGIKELQQQLKSQQQVNDIQFYWLISLSLIIGYILFKKQGSHGKNNDKSI